jgi:hypothetical protein
MHLQLALLASHLSVCLDVHLPPKNGKKLMVVTFWHSQVSHCLSQPALHPVVIPPDTTGADDDELAGADEEDPLGYY